MKKFGSELTDLHLFLENYLQQIFVLRLIFVEMLTNWEKGDASFDGLQSGY
jgi:hypothetical protein